MANLLNTTTTEADARLVRKDKEVAKAGFKLIREWTHIDATAADTLLTTMDAVATYSGPQADGQAYTGTFVNSSVVGSNAFNDAENGERYINILQELILVASPADTTALAALDCLITQENEILTPFALATGEADTIGYVFKNINPSSRATMMAYTDANLVTSLPGATWSYVDRVFKEEDDGTATFTVIFKKVAWNAFVAASPDLTWDDNDSTTHEERHDLWFKITNTDALTGLYTATLLYNVMSVRITERDDGALNIERVQLKEAVGTSGSEIEAVESGVLDQFALQAGTYDQFTIINERMKLKTSAYATPASSTGYTLIQTKEEKRPDGLWNKYYVYRKHTWSAWGHDSYAADTTEYSNPSHERQVVTKTWFGIRKADLATAVSNLANETTPIAVTSNHHVRRIDARDNKDGSVTVSRMEQKVFDNIANTDATLVQYDLLNAFALQTAARNGLESVYDDFTETEIEAVSDTTPAGYTKVKSSIEPNGNGFFKGTFIYQKVTWAAWGHDTYAADLTEYDNAGTANEKEVIRKTWFGIVNTSVATAISNCRLGTNVTPESGYVVVSASVRDNQDGSITLVQTQKKQVNNKDAIPGYQAVRPFGWDGGYADEIETHYEHFTAAGLAAAIAGESAPAGYTLVTEEPSLNADGLYSVIYRYRKMTFSNTSGTTPNRVLANTRTYGYVNTDPDAGTYGINAGKTLGADGIPIAAAAEIAGNQTASDSSHVVARVTLSDNGDGSASVRKEEDRLRAKTDQITVEFAAANGTHEETEIVQWYNMTSADADLVVADAKTNTANLAGATYTPSPASHKLNYVRKEPEPNGQSYRVTRVSFIPITRGGSTAPYKIADVAAWKIYGTTFRDGSGGIVNYYIVTVGRRVTTSLADAKTWANLSSVHPSDSHLLGSIEWNDRYEVYLSYKVTLSAAGTNTIA